MSANEFKDSVYVLPIGGIEEIGKNCYLIIDNGEAIMIDCGLLFPDDVIMGIDYIIPDFQILKQLNIKLLALFITHGHEDHIGAIPSLVQNYELPIIYSPNLASKLIKSKFHDLKMQVLPELVIYESKEYKVGPFTITPFGVTHSIPDSFGMFVKTRVGNIVYTGDYKIDLTPIGGDFDLQTLVNFGSINKVKLMLGDSTNAEVPGTTMSEKIVGNSMNEVFRNTTGRLLIATFSSNVYRIQQIVEAAVRFNRKIAIFGRSMERIISIARILGHIKLSNSSIVNQVEMNSLPPEELLILCTGSQGEPLAVLSRVANNAHRNLKLIPGDTVVFSSNPIPGNTQSVTTLVNKLLKLGANVVTNSILNNLHTSGHASKEELKLILKLVKPDYFMPVHGEYKMLIEHKFLAQTIGMRENQVLIARNGDLFKIDDEVTFVKHIDVPTCAIEGVHNVRVPGEIIDTRVRLSQVGIVSFCTTINLEKRKLIKKVKIITKGFIYFRENQKTVHFIENQANNIIYELLERDLTLTEFKSRLEDELSSFLRNTYNKNPYLTIIIHDLKD